MSEIKQGAINDQLSSSVERKSPENNFLCSEKERMFGSCDSSYEDNLKFDYQPGKSQVLKKDKIYTSDTPDDDHESVLVFKENFAAKPKVQRDRNKTKIRPFRKIVDDLGNKSKDHLGDDQLNTSGFKEKPLRSKPRIFLKKYFY
jgi:hypothetical protein